MPKRVKDSKLHMPLLTHMRAVAYAPVEMPADNKNHAKAMAEAADKRSRKNAKRAGHGAPI